MPETFGARMREQRERQQVALSTIAEQTKIKVSLLEALEHDDVSRWPSGIFRRAFVRAYAHAIGLEPDAVLREFLDVYPDPPEVFADALAGNSDDGRATDAAPTRFKYLVASAIGSVSRLRARSPHKEESVLQTVAPMPHRTDHLESLSVQTQIVVEEEPPSTAVAAVGDEEPTVKMMLPVPGDEATVKMTPPAPQIERHVEPAVPVTPDSQPAVAPEPVVQAHLSIRPAESHDPDLLAVAHLCTELGCVQTTADVPPLLNEMTRILDAVGVIIWMWDPIANELRPALSHGYSDRVVAQLPRVERDTNNATAAAFRAVRTCVVKGDDIDNGALAAPLIGPGGCFGVLAIELPERREEREPVRAAAMIFAAQLATLIGTAQPMDVSDRQFVNHA
ncbi:MAG TPA: helix-turn-helix domain-containing protein [Vicinamibacterales bacterium]|nr:helix-turn-helix domain-containing protein [Vicinamibacterales bacterium]